MHVVRVPAVDGSYDEPRKELHLSKKFGLNKPELRFYPNGYTRQEKIDQSFALKLNLNSDDFDEIFDEMHEYFKDDIEHVPSAAFHDAVVRNAIKAKRHVIYFFY